MIYDENTEVNDNMQNFGMFYPIDNFVKELTDEEEYHLELRRKDNRGYIEGGEDIIDILYWLCRTSGAKNVVEIGTGNSTIPLLLACKRNGGKLFSTDIACGSHYTQVKDIWKFPYTDAWTYRFGIDSVEMGKQWNGGVIDFIYLDSSHTYENTIKEISTWLNHLKIGGWIVLHDVTSHVNFVFRAICDMIHIDPTKFEYHHYPNAHGVGILIRRK